MYEWGGGVFRPVVVEIPHAAAADLAVEAARRAIVVADTAVLQTSRS